MGWQWAPAVVVLGWWWATAVQSESLLVVRGLGIQLSTTSRLGTSYTRFIESSRVVDVVLNEAIHRFSVRYYLAILVRDEDRMTVCFPVLMPPLHLLKDVLTRVKSTL
jgi:phosphatidylinositol glycan class H protein